MRAAFLVAEEAVNSGKLRPLVEHNPDRMTAYATELRIPVKSSVSCCLGSCQQRQTVAAGEGRPGPVLTRSGTA